MRIPHDRVKTSGWELQGRYTVELVVWLSKHIVSLHCMVYLNQGDRFDAKLNIPLRRFKIKVDFAKMIAAVYEWQAGHLDLKDHLARQLFEHLKPVVLITFLKKSKGSQIKKIQIFAGNSTFTMKKIDLS